MDESQQVRRTPDLHTDAAFEQAVVSALAAAQVDVSTAQFQFLTQAGPDTSAAVAVASIQKWQDDSALASFRCKQAGQCVPFFVIVRWAGERQRDNALEAAVIKVPVAVHQHKEVLVRAGQTATLVIQNKRLRISTPIICLESGSRGQTIRVSSIDRKRISTAEVVDEGVLRGSL